MDTQQTRADHTDPLLDLQKVLARLVQGGVITSEDSVRIVRTVNRSAKAMTERHDRFGDFLIALMLGIRDGVLVDGEHFRRTSKGLAIHVESTATTLWKARKFSATTREARRLIRFALKRHPDLILSLSERFFFDEDADRRRAVVLHEERAWEFVGGRPKAVPVR